MERWMTLLNESAQYAFVLGGCLYTLCVAGDLLAPTFVERSEMIGADRRTRLAPAEPESGQLGETTRL